VKLTFDGIPERLSVPFTAVKVFFDPSVPYGLQFEESEATDGAAQDGVIAQPTEGTDAEAPVQQALRPAEKKPRAVRKPRSDKPADDQAEKPQFKAPTKQPAANTDNGAAANDAKVVSLDKFRKK
ncbi:MAG: ClpXP protease specificity-enhancing factor SspB, partial [Hyphomicrobiaceae bacterium]